MALTNEVVGDSRERTARSSVAERAREFFLPRCAPREDDVVWGEGDDSVVGSAFASGRIENDEVESARAFQRELFDAGFAWLRGPREFGGSEFSPNSAKSSLTRRVNSIARTRVVFMWASRSFHPHWLSTARSSRRIAGCGRYGVVTPSGASSSPSLTRVRTFRHY